MNRSPENRKALGKGLSALLPARQNPKPLDSSVAPAEAAAGGVHQIAVDSIQPNPIQPRVTFEADKLSELAQSIRANGIIQPLIVQKLDRGEFQLVAGERRWRAAKLAGLTEVPVVIQEFAADRLLEIALIENIQRQDLNPIEVAQALDRLARDYKLSHEEIGIRTGKDRTTVTNLLRLLKLSTEIQLLVAEHRISMGHARAILALPTPELQKQVAEKIAAQGMSVRESERLIQSLTSKRNAPEQLQPPKEVYDAREDPNVIAATREMEACLGTRVKIVAQAQDRGRIEIEYYSFEELNRIYNQIIGVQKEN